MPRGEKSNKTEENFFELIGFIDIPLYYKRMEQEVLSEKELDKIAISLGFTSDNYYCAHEQMIATNARNMGKGIGSATHS